MAKRSSLLPREMLHCLARSVGGAVFERGFQGPSAAAFREYWDRDRRVNPNHPVHAETEDIRGLTCP
eukprot:5318368-Alexandrium_andersonii.AAC.1